MPHVRGQGKAKKLLLETLRECREKGVAISTLYAADWPIYRACGYELAGSFFRFKADIREFSSPAKIQPSALTPLSPWQSDKIKSIYSNRAQVTDGWLDRNEAIWRRVTTKSEGEKETENFCYEIGNGAGYFVHSQESMNMEAEIFIQDYVFETNEAVEQFFSFLSYHSSIFKNVYWKGCPKGGFFIHNLHKNFSVVACEHWMLRILSVENALMQRGYPEGLNVEVCLSIIDPDIVENSGDYVLSVQNGKAELAGSRKKGIAMNIATLSSLFSGFLHPREALRMGRVEGPVREIEKLSLFSSGESPWCPDYF